MSALYAGVLGIVQGLAEFLPISSSAHLILARVIFGWESDAFGLPFDVACHMGTLAAVFMYFRRDLIAMALSLRQPFADTRAARLGRLIVIGTIPAIVVGLLFGDLIEARLRTPLVAATLLALGGIALIIAERLASQRRDEHSLVPGEGFALGCAQALALVPGVSRSGITMTLGLLFGLRRDNAARFAFLLGVPATLAAGLKEGLDVSATGINSEETQLFAIGLITSAIVGYLTIKYFIRYVAHHRLTIFAYYRLIVAALVLVWLAVKAQ